MSRLFRGIACAFLIATATASSSAFAQKKYDAGANDTCSCSTSLRVCSTVRGGEYAAARTRVKLPLL